LNVSPVPVKHVSPAGHSLVELQRFVQMRRLAAADPPQSSVSHCCQLVHAFPTSPKTRALHAAFEDWPACLFGSPTRQDFPAAPLIAAQTQPKGQLSLEAQSFVQNECWLVPTQRFEPHSDGATQDDPRSL